ncbi:hypothetical protein F511_37933 [Dorcoceras hygrometricum]|uniref:Dystroglycan-like n=1 Tax=Dorcoceras hygrometricum TaxID=472368 RepID=A0A2Z7APZ1_9LAMI|nr:hypothetical protein F511_37933 [Dorcoceras hygrometricum]
MASSLYSNAQHVDFESVLGMDDPGMVSMFEALVASGLRGFLGCPTIVYEDALVDLFENASVRSGVVISTVGGQLVEISEKLFAETFELPIDGLGDLSEMPKDAIFYARSIVSLSGEQISLSGRKNQMKMPFRLLCDIVAKAISVKAGSFNAITVEKFSLITAVVCGVKMNWAKFLFGVLKKMVSVKSKQAKGFAVQISRLLATVPTLELGESSEFPASKILSKKTVLRFVSINDRDGAEEVSGAVKQKAVTKKRPAADVEAAVPKKKRTVKKKSISSISSQELVEVAEEAIPIQQVAESLDVEEPRCSYADAVDLIIQQVLDETRAADAPADITQPAVTEEKNWFDLPYDDLVKQWEAERPVVMASDTEDEDIATEDVAPAVGVQQEEEVVTPISAVDAISADEQMSLDDILLSIPVDIPLPSTCMEVTKIKMSQMIKIPGVTKWTWFLKHLPRIPADDKGKEILVEKDPVKGNPAKEHYSLICADIDLLVDLRAKVIAEWTWFLKHLPRIPADDKGKEILVEKDPVKGNPAKEHYSLICADIDLLVDLRAKVIAEGARQETHILDDVHTIRFNEFRKTVLTQNATIFQGLADVRKEVDAVNAKVDIMAKRNATIFQGLADVRKEVDAVNAKVDIMAKRLTDIQKDAEATKEALSHQLLEFQSSAQDNHNVIHAQLSELVDYIHRGSADKKGESGSRGLQKPADTQKEGSAVTPTFEQRVQMAQRRIVQTVLNADANRESQDAAERDRERRRKEARSLKRRRKD